MKVTSFAVLIFSSSIFVDAFVPHFLAAHPARATISPSEIHAADTAVTPDSTAVSADAAMGAEAISALTKNVKTVFSLEDINKILPHRYPFLLVDKVVEYEVGKVRV